MNNNKKTFPMRKIVFMWILAYAGIMVSCLHQGDSTAGIPAAPDTIVVKTITLLKKEVSLPIFASGQFITDDEAILSFKTGGVINDVLVNEGDFVKKDQVLATLKLTEIESMVSQAQLGLEKAKRDHNRVQNLYKDSVATMEQYQNSKTALDVATQVLNGALFNLSYSQIVALSDGYVLKKFANTGQVVGSGTPVLQCSGAGENIWKFRVGLSDKDWAAVSIHDVAEITTDAFPDESLEGKVRSKSKGADSFTGTFFIEIEILNPDHPLATGLYGKAVITPQKKITVWPVPYEALLEGNEGRGYLFITNDKKTAQKLKVSISSLNKDEVLVGKGLENARYLIVAGSSYLSDGSLIKVPENTDTSLSKNNTK